MSVSKSQVLSLYRQILRGGSQFVDYNFRSYTHRIAKEDFRKFASESDPQMIEALYNRGLEQLGVVQRQAINNRMYSKKLSIIDPKSRSFLQQEDAHLSRFAQ